MLGAVVRILFVLALLLACACVERRLFVRTDPPGAVVRVNGETLGRSPVSWRFDHYGTVRVEAELPDREPAEKIVKLAPPWYQYPVLDFFADVVVPARIHDRHEVLLVLPAPAARSEAEIERELRELARGAKRLRDEAEAEARKP